MGMSTSYMVPFTWSNDREGAEPTTHWTELFAFSRCFPCALNQACSSDFKSLYSWQHIKYITGTVVTKKKKFSCVFCIYLLTSCTKSSLWSVDSTCSSIDLVKSVIKAYSYLVLGSKGFSLMIFLGTLLVIHLGMPTNRKFPSLQVRREVDMFWETTRFNSAWLASALRAHGVSWSACLHPWPVANQHSSMVTWTVHQFSGKKKKKCPQRWATCILLAQSTFKVVPIWLHSLEDTRSSCAGNKW